MVPRGGLRFICYFACVRKTGDKAFLGLGLCRLDQSHPTELSMILGVIKAKDSPSDAKEKGAMYVTNAIGQMPNPRNSDEQANQGVENSVKILVEIEKNDESITVENDVQFE